MTIKLLLAASASSVFLLAGCSAGQQPAMSGGMSGDMTPSAMTTSSAMMEPSGSAMSGSAMMMSSARYVTYDTYSGSMSDFAKTTQVLFFYSASDAASTTLDQTLMTDVAQLPDGTTIVKVDRDAMMSTSDKFQVSGPHTFVVLAADGTGKSTFQATTLDELASHLKA